MSLATVEGQAKKACLMVVLCFLWHFLYHRSDDSSSGEVLFHSSILFALHQEGCMSSHISANQEHLPSRSPTANEIDTTNTASTAHRLETTAMADTATTVDTGETITDQLIQENGELRNTLAIRTQENALLNEV